MVEVTELESLERLESLLGQIQGAKVQHQLGDALDAAVRAVDGAESAISRLEKLAGFTELVSGFLDPSDPQRCTDLLIKVRTLGQRLSQASDTATLQDGKTEVFQLPTQVDQFDRIINRGWNAKIDHAFAAIGQLGLVLREISETQQLGLEMEEVVRQANQLAAGLADAKGSAAQFEDLANKRDRSKKNLADLGAGKEVVDFLSAVASRSATLASMTEGVRAWLEERNALERFKVGL